MTTPVSTRFSAEELVLLDQLVAQGAGENRSEVIRRSVHQFAETLRRERTGAVIAESYRKRPQHRAEDELAMANALAMTEAEPW